jgi:hypothetical protein
MGMGDGGSMRRNAIVDLTEKKVPWKPGLKS